MINFANDKKSAETHFEFACHYGRPQCLFSMSLTALLPSNVDHWNRGYRIALDPTENQKFITMIFLGLGFADKLFLDFIG